jgi:hypothetical protein
MSLESAYREGAACGHGTISRLGALLHVRTDNAPSTFVNVNKLGLNMSNMLT